MLVTMVRHDNVVDTDTVCFGLVKQSGWRSTLIGWLSDVSVNQSEYGWECRTRLTTNEKDRKTDTADMSMYIDCIIHYYIFITIGYGTKLAKKVKNMSNMIDCK